MPPPGELPLGDPERAQLLAWMRHAVDTVDPMDPANHNPGPPQLRRLSLAEYNNTVRDLLGFPFDAAAAVGLNDERDEGNSYGNLAAALEIPPALLDKYFAAADGALDRLFGTELRSDIDGDVQDRARVSRERLFMLKPGTWNKPDAKVAPPDGVAERDAARQILAAFVRRAYRRPATPADVDRVLHVYDLASAKGQDYVHAVRLALKAVLVSPKFLFRVESDPPAARPGTIARVDDHELASRLSYFLWSSMPDAELMALADAGKLSAPGVSPQPVRYACGPIGPPSTSREHPKDFAFDGDPYTFFEGPAGSWVGLDLGTPRPITEIRYASHPRYGFEKRMPGGRFQASNSADFRTGVVDLFTVTAPPAPGVLTRQPVEAPGEYRYLRFLSSGNEPAHLAELEVWGRANGTVLQTQVQRMLADPKARALTENFAAQWLQIRKLPSARPSTEFFPEFQPDIRKDMFDETATFFDMLRVRDRSVLDLLTADYTYLNEELAKYYGIPGVAGTEMREVPLKPEYHRGGLLGMGSVLALTSHTYRTSPTMRGKYVLEVIFGTPPPPPPPNAGIFKDEGDKQKQPKTFRERMALHASDPACAACHRQMDPLGYALEEYNAVGIWRKDDHGRPLDTAGELPSGEKLDGVAGLKSVVLQRKEQFTRNVVSQMLTYALGRELDYYDDGPVNEIAADLANKDHRFSTLILDVVKSYPFQYRRAAALPAQAAPAKSVPVKKGNRHGS